MIVFGFRLIRFYCFEGGLIRFWIVFDFRLIRFVFGLRAGFDYVLGFALGVG